MSALRVAILASADESLAHGDPRDALAVGAAAVEVDAIAAACRELGHVALVRTVDPERPDRTIRALVEDDRCDVAVHLVASLRGEARFEAAVAWLLEWARVSHTGSRAEALTIALEKPVARAVLAARGVPVPRGAVLERADGSIALDLRASRRWIVKPAASDASHGIDVGSVVETERALRERAAFVIERYAQPALVEEFVDGRELNASCLGTRGSLTLLPLGEIDFATFPSGLPRLVTYDAKWREESVEYRTTPAIAARAMSGEQERRVRDVVRDTLSAIDLAGPVRVDLRLDPERGPFVIDVNPNPDLSPDAGFARAALRAGLPYRDLVARLLDDALRGGAR